ncbi:MAG: FAD-dependent oxidoreductase, partial [Candidatus Yanofskybacteria bacterium]|nr:FAD-dependent oxidoreductase [Candidatus Yanofskybacteria bacterium]
GFTGIEVAAEFACCVKTLSRMCGIKGRCERIMLLEAGPKILPTVSDDERRTILKRLTHLGVEVMENAAVEEAGSDYIKLKTGKHIETDLIMWTAGIRLPDLLKYTPGLPLAEKSARGGSPSKDGQAASGGYSPVPSSGGKKIQVNNDLEVVGLPGVFAIGDNTEFIDFKTGKSVPALAYVAVDQGKIVAKNILRILKTKPLVSYYPFYGVWIAPIGGKYALVHLWGGLNVKGFWGWVIRELVDFKYMLSILPVKKAVSILWQEVTLFTKND